MAELAVIGGGVVGLSAAQRLLQAGHSVTVYARELGRETTSAAAGAIWWGHVEGTARDWALVSLKHFQCMSKIHDSGVRIIRLRDVYPYPVAEEWFAKELPVYERIPANHLPKNYQDGFLMDVPLVEPPLYLAYLMAEIETLGGRIEKRVIHDFSELEQKLIVNCSGLGARELARDAGVYPVRGQVLRVDAPQVKDGFMDDESFTYLFPRGDGLLLGGIAQAHDDSLAVDARTREGILERCQVIEPSIAQSAILGEAVGLRPARENGVRLGMEKLEAATVIHNYGHGGVGFTLSWGCAEAVLGMVEGELKA